jgi:RNAse (barnase) inhibitor barstar
MSADIDAIWDRQMAGYGRKQADTDVLALLTEVDEQRQLLQHLEDEIKIGRYQNRDLTRLGNAMSEAIEHPDLEDWIPVMFAAKAAWDEATS